jgi:hypothetical protein
MVWYTYVTTGPQNTFTVTPGTLTNAQIVIFLGGCPSGAGVLQTCKTGVGSAVVTTTWGLPLGTQIWVGVASDGGNDGTFQLCISSTTPPPSAGQYCSSAIPLCNKNPYVATMTGLGSSGQTPGCFANPTQQDIFLQFTVTVSGTLAWTGNGSNAATEYDWAFWNITGGCPGTLFCCNYNYAGGSSAGFGMQNQAGNVPCGYNAPSSVTSQEFSPTMAVTAGQTYCIQISNYNNDGNGFTFHWTNSTCQISPNAAFTINPNSFTCGASVSVSITNTSVGSPQTWNYGDGSPNYVGTTPPIHVYNTPGTYAITENIAGVCPSTATQYVKLYGPLSANITGSISKCSPCNGTASVTGVTGGDGTYTYLWSPSGGTMDNASGLCAGTYTCTISNATCGTSINKVVTITQTPTPTLSLTSSTNPNCFSQCTGTATMTVGSGTAPFVYSWSPNVSASNSVNSL